MAATSKQSTTAAEIQAQPLRGASSRKGLKKLLNMGSTFLTVAVLTGLLWVWADQAQLLGQDVRLVFTVATAAESPLIIMSVRGDSGGEASEAPGGGKSVRVKVKFKGTRSRLRELQDDLQSGRLELFAYLSETSYLPGEQTISVADLLNANEDLRDCGVTAIETEPDKISVVLDKWVRMERVKLAVKDTAETPRFQAYVDPPEIAVEVPASLKKELERQPQTLLVELTQIPDKIPPNLEVVGTVSTKFGGQPVRPERSKVNVILQPIEQAREKLGPLQIYAFIPPDMIGTYYLEWDDEANKVIEVEVIGPQAELDKLKTAAKEKVRAYIELSATHAEPTETYYTVPVQLWFSEDVHNVKPVGPAKTVKVRLRKLIEK